MEKAERNANTILMRDSVGKGKPVGRQCVIVPLPAAIAFLLFLPLFSLSGQQAPASSQNAEPDTFYRKYIGLNDDQISSIRSGRAIAKIINSPTPDEVFV